MGNFKQDARRLLLDVVQFAYHASGLELRKYQEGPARAIFNSIENKRGDTIVIMFPRQSGKNELQAQIETHLLTMFGSRAAEMVKVSPTWKPQSLNAMRRLERVLTKNLVTRGRWKKEQGYIYRHQNARIYFLSGQPGANVVGATANLLLACDEAQDIQIHKWDKDFALMAASINATRVFWGTAWTSRTLLARELRAAREAQEKDGVERVFIMTADDVAKEVPEYGDFVAAQVAKLSRNHPLVKTQYFSEEIDAEGGMFTVERKALMKADHASQVEPSEGKLYAFLIDVAGEDEAGGDEIEDLERDKLKNPARDATALTIVEVDLVTLEDELLKAPTYKVVHRKLWVGNAHTTLYGQIRALAGLWDPRYIVVDATGVGAGLTSFLSKSLPERVLPFVFTSKSKSDLGYGFLAVCDTGRFKDHKLKPSFTPAGIGTEQSMFWHQIDNVQYEARENKVIRWSVPDGTRDSVTGELVHDDLVISAALCAELDKQEWFFSGRALIVRPKDPLEDMDHGF